jgi:para-aminobenzoate synthetase / 4-amino-4-deoxychorismate lyase
MSFYLFETIRIDKNGAQFLSEHLERLQKSAHFFGFRWQADITKQIADTLSAYQDIFPAKLRISLAFDGTITQSISPYIDTFEGKKRLWLYPEPVSSDYIYLYHKNSNRHFYEDTFEEASDLGYREVVYLNERGELTEGSRTNIFLQQGEFIFTPPVYCGLLSGIYRKHLLNTQFNASEKILYEKDLRTADKIWCVNVLRQQEEVFLD